MYKNKSRVYFDFFILNEYTRHFNGDIKYYIYLDEKYY